MQKKDLTPGRVELPDMDEESEQQIAEWKEYVEWRTRTQAGFLKALFMKTPRPFTGIAKPLRKPTKHQRQIAKARRRSEYLASVGRSRKPGANDA